MENVQQTEPATGEEAAYFQEAIRRIFAEAELLDAQIAQDQAEIALLRAETRAILTELKSTICPASG